MKNNISSDKMTVFKEKLAGYKSIIDDDIKSYSEAITIQTREQFGEYSAQSMGVFCDVLARGGKRIRGALTMLAYEMYGGKNDAVAIEAARIMELLQTYLLVVDDVYDRSKTRRGSPSAHVMLEKFHIDKHWKDNSHHFGESIAFNSGLIGCHLSMTLVSELGVDADTRIKALILLNQNLKITAEGQANDIYNEVIQTTDKMRVENVLVWKTAYYTFVNPLQFGAILAGASDDELKKIREFSLFAGRTFQITDDILGTFGSEFESGKSPMDDMREGKRTLLTVHALQNTSIDNANFLEKVLGKHNLTNNEFTRAKNTILEAGSLSFANNEAMASAKNAVSCINKFWAVKFTRQAEFLEALIFYLLDRKS